MNHQPCAFAQLACTVSNGWPASVVRIVLVLPKGPGRLRSHEGLHGYPDAVCAAIAVAAMRWASASEADMLADAPSAIHATAKATAQTRTLVPTLPVQKRCQSRRSKKLNPGHTRYVPSVSKTV